MTTAKPTTVETITDEQIEALSREAAEAGDMQMVATCAVALRGVQQAVEACVAAIQRAEAMRDSE